MLPSVAPLAACTMSCIDDHLLQVCTKLAMPVLSFKNVQERFKNVHKWSALET
jgi:hypothetical protein